MLITKTRRLIRRNLALSFRALPIPCHQPPVPFALKSKNQTAKLPCFIAELPCPLCEREGLIEGNKRRVSGLSSEPPCYIRSAPIARLDYYHCQKQQQPIRHNSYTPKGSLLLLLFPVSRSIPSLLFYDKQFSSNYIPSSKTLLFPTFEHFRGLAHFPILVGLILNHSLVLYKSSLLLCLSQSSLILSPAFYLYTVR